MPTQQHRGILLALSILIGLILTGGPLRAESRWTVRGQGSFWLAIDDQTPVIRASASEIEERSTHSISDGNSFGLSLEFVAKRQLGIEVGFLIGSIDTDFTTNTAGSQLADSDSFDTYATTVGLNYHFTPRRRADIYLGAFIQQINFSDVTFLTTGGSRRLSFDDDYGGGLKLGVDVPFKTKSSWVFSGDIRYVATILESEQPEEDLDLHPLILSVGIGYRF